MKKLVLVALTAVMLSAAPTQSCVNPPWPLPPDPKCPDWPGHPKKSDIVLIVVLAVLGMR